MAAEFCLGIIGSAGRQEPIMARHWDWMHAGATALLERLAAEGRIVSELVSGGAAGADHLAIRLLLDQREGQGHRLQLHLAAGWDRAGMQYQQSEGRDWLSNPGRTLNRHHRNFQLSSGVDSFADLQEALERSDCCCSVEEGGLLGRNGAIARRADLLLAMTFGQGRQVAQGGTADTCRKFLALGKTEIYHLDLNTGDLLEGAQVPAARR